MVSGIAHLCILENKYPGYKIYSRLHYLLKNNAVDKDELKKEIRRINTIRYDPSNTHHHKETQSIYPEYKIINSEAKIKFFSPEMLHLLFVRQKNLVIFPLAPFEFIQKLSNFTVGYEIKEFKPPLLPPTEFLQYYTEEHTRSLFIIHDIKKEGLAPLTAIESLRYIVNCSEKLTPKHIRVHPETVFYNWRTGTFFNCLFPAEGMKVENGLLAETARLKELRTRLEKAKMIAENLYQRLDKRYPSRDVRPLLEGNNGLQYRTIFQFMDAYYDNIYYDGDYLRIQPAPSQKDSLLRHKLRTS
jgi:hypothetical protein